MSQQPDAPFLVWLYPGYLDRALDAATWLDTTHELRKLGWKVALIVAGPRGLRTIDGTEVYCIPMPDIYLLRQLIFHVRCYWFLVSNYSRIDVILFDQMSAPWLMPISFARKLMRRKHPLLAIDIRSLHMPSPKKQGIKGWLRGEFQELAGKKANHWVDGYLTITSRMADFFHVRQDRLWGAWPSGVDLELFEEAQHAHSWPSQNAPVRLVYVGTLNVERNLLNLCRAIEQANAEGMPFELWLVGEGDELPELEKYADKMQGQIMIKKPVPHRQVPNILAQAHIGVLPFPDEIKFQVSSPIKLFEYMAAGMPILATRIVCHTDVVGGGQYVFWAENASVSGLLGALQTAWQHREALMEMGTRAAFAARSWTWHESALKLKGALEYGLGRNLS